MCMQEKNALLQGIVQMMIDSTDIEYFYMSFIDRFYDSIFTGFMTEDQKKQGSMMRDTLKQQGLLVLQENSFWGEGSHPYAYFGIIPIFHNAEIIGYFITTKSEEFTIKQKAIIQRGIFLINNGLDLEKQTNVCTYHFKFCDLLRVFNSNLSLDKKLEHVFVNIKKVFSMDTIMYIKDEANLCGIPEFILEKQYKKHMKELSIPWSQVEALHERTSESQEMEYWTEGVIQQYIPSYVIDLFHMKEVLFLPLPKQSKVIGFALFYSQEKISISPAFKSLIQRVLVEVNSAIEGEIKWNEHIYRVMELSTLHDIIEKVKHKELSREEIMNTIVQAVPKVTGLSRCTIGLLDSTGLFLRPKYSTFSNPLQTTKISLDRSSVKDRTAILAIETKEPIIVYNAREDERCDPDLAKELGVYSNITVPLLDNKNEALGVIYLDNEDFRIFKEKQVEYYMILARQIALLIENSRAVNEIGKKAIKDGLLSIYNREYINRQYEQFKEEYIQHQVPYAIMMIDLDYFKQINDTFGHGYGDEVLVRAVEVIQEHIRQQDIVGRYGGEEFVILLPMIYGKEAVKVAERIRRATQALIMKRDITVSIGVADCTMSDNPMVAADEALYIAKENGRNQVQLYK